MKRHYINPAIRIVSFAAPQVLQVSLPLDVDSTEGEGGWGPAQAKESVLDLDDDIELEY